MAHFKRMMRIPLPAGLALSIAVLVSARSSAQQGAPAPGTPPPLRLAGVEKRTPRIITGHADVEGGAIYGMTSKTVTFYWRRDFSSHLPDPLTLSSDGGFVSVQEESMGFWPTEVCGFGTDKVCVAGKTSAGKTRIQVWTLDSSATLEDPYIDSEGVKKYPETFLPVTTKVDVYHDSQAGKQLVRAMFRNHGSPTKLFVQFDDVRDLWTLDTTTGTWTKVLTTAQQVHLLDESLDRWSAHHGTGYFYAFSTSAGTLLLFDQDLDGALDSAHAKYLTGNQWYSGVPDFSDKTGYVETF
jgi:hypothetical protein